MRWQAVLAVFLLIAAAPVFADVEVRRAGSQWARIENDGTIRLAGNAVGKFERDGTVRERGSAFAKIESDGTIRLKGSQWGQASACCGEFHGKRAVAALIVFFTSDFSM